MAEFRCDVAEIVVETHPDPEVTALEVGRVNDYRVVVKKDAFHTGQKIAYIPEQALVPEKLLEALGLTGRLAGSLKNRVKPIKLRGVMSQGLVYWDEEISKMELGADATEYLGVTKYEPVIPAKLQGQVNYSGINFKFDIENIKKWNRVFVDGEEVILTEKIHGTFSVFGLIKESERVENLTLGKFFVSSKGQASKGLFLKDVEENAHNTYMRVFKEQHMAEKLEFIKDYLETEENVWAVGEISGVQKGFGYGANGDKPGYRCFGIKVGDRYLSWGDLESTLIAAGIDVVPVLYKGPFSKEILAEYTSGTETITGKATHIREGVVVYPAQERTYHNLGRVILKSISDEYLAKSSGEEFN